MMNTIYYKSKKQIMTERMIVVFVLMFVLGFACGVYVTNRFTSKKDAEKMGTTIIVSGDSYSVPGDGGQFQEVAMR